MFDADKIIAALQTDPSKVLDQLKAGGAELIEKIKTDPATRNVALGTGAGVLTGILLGRGGGKFLGTAAKAGGLAAIAGLAYHAWQKSKGAQPNSGDTFETPDATKGFLPSPQDVADQEAHGKAILRAMIGAAKADGTVDDGERAKIFDRLGQVDLGPAEQEFLFDELVAPLDLQAIAAGAPTPELAAQVYAAALLSITPDHVGEQAFLDQLAIALKLDPALRAELHAAV